MEHARTLVLVGPMGAGKSVVGARVARRLGWTFVDIDARVEADAGTSISALFERHGEAAFRALEREALRDALHAQDVVIATGGGAVLDARNREAMRASGFVAHLHLDVDRQLERLHGDTSRPLLATDDRAERLQTLAAIRTPLYADVAHVRIDTGTLPVDDVVDAVLRALEHWNASS